MRNRIIIVPKDKKAEKLLDYDDAISTHLIELELSEEDFMFLWNEQIINLINMLGETNIDDFEDDCILNRKFKKIIIVKLSEIKLHLNNKNRLLIEKIIILFEEAISRNTGVYFFF